MSCWVGVPLADATCSRFKLDMSYVCVRALLGESCTCTVTFHISTPIHHANEEDLLLWVAWSPDAKLTAPLMCTMQSAWSSSTISRATTWQCGPWCNHFLLLQYWLCLPSLHIHIKTWFKFSYSVCRFSRVCSLLNFYMCRWLLIQSFSLSQSSLLYCIIGILCFV
jgi:hypothetical protein